MSSSYIKYFFFWQYTWKEEDEREEEEMEDKYKPGAAGYFVCNQDRSWHFETEKKKTM